MNVLASPWVRTANFIISLLLLVLGYFIKIALDDVRTGLDELYQLKTNVKLVEYRLNKLEEKFDLQKKN